MQELVILHVNDIHAHFQNWYSQVMWIQERRRELEAQGKTVWVVDLGDFADRVHPLMEATDCQVVPEMLRQLTTNMITIGNNEGLANLPYQINAMYQTANFDVLLANMFHLESGEFAEFAKRYRVLEVENCRIGIFGLTAPFPDCYVPNGWYVATPDEVLPELLADLQREQVDLCIFLSHLGLQEDMRISEEFPQISVILGAHTHHVLPKGQRSNQSFLTGAGKHGRYIGELTLTLQENQIIKIEERLIDLNELHSKIDEQIEQQLLQRGQRLLDEQAVITLPRTLSVEELTQYSLQAMCEAANCTVAFSYSGLFLKELSEGNVTRLDLHECMPHPIHLNRCTLLAKDFEQLLLTMEQLRDTLSDLAIIGRGFRGKIFGKLHGCGIEKQGLEYKINGQPLSELESVTFVCPDHMRFVDYFPMIREKGQNEIIYPELLRNIMGNYFQILEEKGIL